jgi:hypothetical protein
VSSISARIRGTGRRKPSSEYSLERSKGFGGSRVGRGCFALFNPIFGVGRVVGGYSIKKRHRRGSGNSLEMKFFWPETIDFLKLDVVTGRLLFRMLPDRGQCQ